ncbi:hypothetical protein BD289DRAFT_229573 [Coniella lustricola]|uniref:Uncharacterized protein n=1 Tax=Coniella lustricola TaxID=2025994 RepID=A0A2T2ZRT7_9PEZI|nr:hypothetical protein BD289DRAFT_229573 [Coniella lustricola]
MSKHCSERKERKGKKKRQTKKNTPRKDEAMLDSRPSDETEPLTHRHLVKKGKAVALRQLDLVTQRNEYLRQQQQETPSQAPKTQTEEMIRSGASKMESIGDDGSIICNQLALQPRYRGKTPSCLGQTPYRKLSFVKVLHAKAAKKTRTNGHECINT